MAEAGELQDVIEKELQARRMRSKSFVTRSPEDIWDLMTKLSDVTLSYLPLFLRILLELRFVDCRTEQEYDNGRVKAG